MLLFGSFSPALFAAVLIGVGIGMTVHEFAHNYVAHLMGDDTPEKLGKLTLNPMAHIYWPGWLMFAIIGFGPLGYAQISAHRMRDPRWGYLAAVAAGPLSNLIVAALFALPLRLLFTSQDLIFALRGVVNSPLDFVVLIFVQTVFWNVLLFIFNLLPLYPIDGWTIVYGLLPPDLAYRWESWKQYTQYIFFGLILLSFAGIGPNILGVLIGGPANNIIRLLLGF